MNQVRIEEQISEDPHVLHMWQPFSFRVGPAYDYCRNRWWKRLGDGLFRGIVQGILWAYNGLALGFRVTGRAHLREVKGRGAVTVCNHVHPMDCTMVDLAVFPRRIHYMTLDTNFRIPVVRHLIRWLGAVPLSQSPRQIGALFQAMGQELDTGALVQIYPEGVLIPYDDTLRTFKGGAFRLAADNGVSVVPMVIVQEPPRGLLRLYKRKPCLHLCILPPIAPEPNLPPREAARILQARCREAMAETLNGKGTAEKTAGILKKRA